MSSDDVDLQELYDLLEQYKDVPITEIEFFIKECGLTATPKKKTLAPIIYYAYCKWKLARLDEDKTPPMQRSWFFKLLTKYFKQGWRDSHRRYLVDSEHFNLTKEEVEDALCEADRERKWRISKRNFAEATAKMSAIRHQRKLLQRRKKEEET